MILKRKFTQNEMSPTLKNMPLPLRRLSSQANITPSKWRTIFFKVNWFNSNWIYFTLSIVDFFRRETYNIIYILLKINIPIERSGRYLLKLTNYKSENT